jgi:hypothetical protein
LFHESPAEPLDGSARDVVVPIEERAPAPVTDLGRPLGGVDDVGEKDGRQDAFAHHWMTDARDELDYRVEDRLMVLGVPAAMDVTRELDVAGVVDVRAVISPESRGHEVVAGRVDDQCRHCRVPSLSTSFSSILEIRRTQTPLGNLIATARDESVMRTSVSAVTFRGCMSAARGRPGRAAPELSPEVCATDGYRECR